MVPKNKDLITGVPLGTTYHQVASGGGGYGDPKSATANCWRKKSGTA